MVRIRVGVLVAEAAHGDLAQRVWAAADGDVLFVDFGLCVSRIRRIQRFVAVDGPDSLDNILLDRGPTRRRKGRARVRISAPQQVVDSTSEVDGRSAGGILRNDYGGAPVSGAWAACRSTRRSSP